MKYPKIIGVSPPSKYNSRHKKEMKQRKRLNSIYNWILYDFSLTVKAAPHECVIRTGQS